MASIEVIPVMVTWLDACRHDESDETDDLAPLNVVTFGHLVKRTDEYIVLAAECHDPERADSQYRDVTTIPMGMVRSITYLHTQPAAPETVEFEHTPVEAPYTQDGVACGCRICAVVRKIEARELLEGDELDIARREGWLPADPERVAH